MIEVEVHLCPWEEVMTVIQVVSMRYEEIEVTGGQRGRIGPQGSPGLVISVPVQPPLPPKVIQPQGTNIAIKKTGLEESFKSLWPQTPREIKF